MTRRRDDGVGYLHHVTNRGLAKRAMFEGEADMRLFLSLLARAVRAGFIEVIAFSILSSHFHLLVRSPRGELSKALQWIQSNYSRAYNRGRGRDGTLVKGRFASKRVQGERYWRTVIGYIDWNPVDAGLAEFPDEYLYGSARYYVQKRRPRWLATHLIDEMFPASAHGIDVDAYRQFSKPSSRQFWTVDAKLRSGDIPSAEKLLSSGPADGALQWFKDRAKLADGVYSPPPVASPAACDDAVGVLRENIEALDRRFSRGKLHRQVRIALTHELAGLSPGIAAVRTGASRWTGYRDLDRHRAMILDSDSYAAICVDAARLAVDLSLAQSQSDSG